MQNKTGIFLLIFFVTCWYTSIKAQKVAENQLKVLTWNVYMLPFFINTTNRVDRAKSIVDVLKHSDYDVIVLQETFHKKSFKIIEEGLKRTFPYQIKANRKGSFFKYHHGIFIISKLPAKVLGTITFENCSRSDCLAKKGAVLIELKKDGQAFQILGTHLQSIDGDRYEAIRKTQRKQITYLIKNNYKVGVPQLLCGDFNTNYNNLTRRVDLLNDLEITEANIPEEVTWPHKFYKAKKTHTAILDYIFVKLNNFNFSNSFSKVQNFYDEKQKLALSDHAAVEMILLW